MNKSKWITIWVRGELKNPKTIWKEWVETIVPFDEDLPGGITHFGAKSSSFKSAKYLSYKRSKNRLLRAINDLEEFQSLSFITVPDEYTTMIQDQRFGLSLQTKKFDEITGDFQREYFEVRTYSIFESITLQFFNSGRLEVFETGNVLPVNYRINFAKKDGYKPKGFRSIRIKNID
jgi:hypothetical protein